MFKSVEELLKRASRPITEPHPTLKMIKDRNKMAQPENNRFGDGWFNMRGEKMTPELERDLKLLAMRDALDPHRHYKKGEKIGVNKIVQVGTIVEGAGEFFSSRLCRKDRKATLVDALLSDEQKRSNYKKRFMTLQKQSLSGTYRDYKKQRNKRLPTSKRDSDIKQVKRIKGKGAKLTKK